MTICTKVDFKKKKIYNNQTHICITVKSKSNFNLTVQSRMLRLFCGLVLCFILIDIGKLKEKSLFILKIIIYFL